MTGSCDASNGAAYFVSTISQVECSDTSTKVGAVVGSRKFRIACNAGESCHHKRLIAVPDGYAEPEHRPFEYVVNVDFGVFADVEQDRYALFAAAARSVARRLRSLR